MKSYDDGSDENNLLTSETGNSVPSPVTSLGNQMFIMFSTYSNDGGKGFTAKITFGNIIMILQYYTLINVFFGPMNFLGIQNLQYSTLGGIA